MRRKVIWPFITKVQRVIDYATLTIKLCPWLAHLLVVVRVSLQSVWVARSPPLNNDLITNSNERVESRFKEQSQNRTSRRPLREDRGATQERSSTAINGFF